MTAPPERSPRSARSILTGRQGARSSFWDATAALAKAWWSQPASLATARRPEPLYVFGAAGAPSDNRKTEPRDALNASSLARLYQRSLRSPLKKREKKSRTINVRLLTRGAIYVFGERRATQTIVIEVADATV